MRQYFERLKQSILKGDWMLLLLCVFTSAFGCLVTASTTNYINSPRYIIMQIAGTVIGILFFAIISSLNVDFFMEHRNFLALFNVVVLAMLIPFGVEVGGNKSWVNLPILPFNIQVAEICKITYILIAASIMNAHKENISSLGSILHLGAHLLLLFGLNMVLSDDMGVSLIFVFILGFMAFAGGVNILWFIGFIGLIILAFPVVWPRLDAYQRLRIEVLFNPALDPDGTGPLWQTTLSLRSLTGGGMTGQGLFNGHRTQNDAFTGQHTDFVFSAIGEELGFVGCALVLVMLGAIIARCIWVGFRSPDYARRMICFGAAAALIFQTLINVGMCIGVAPVIGLTLPFISYGPSSLVSLFAMLGLVSGIYARPVATSHERYIRPPLS